MCMGKHHQRKHYYNEFLKDETGDTKTFSSLLYINIEVDIKVRIVIPFVQNMFFCSVESAYERKNVSMPEKETNA